MTGAAVAAALHDGRRTWSHEELRAQVAGLSEQLTRCGTRVLATLLDNSPAWVVADLAALEAGIVHVPLPLFFSNDQLTHAMAVTGADTLLAPVSLAGRWKALSEHACTVAGSSLMRAHLPAVPAALPHGTAKITFTSGTTGLPKGVCLSADAMNCARDGLAAALAPLGIERHLCALPFAVLLENLAGLMAPLAHGATCQVLPLAQIGLAGSSSFDAARFHDAVVRLEPHSTILLPQMLRAWLGHLQQTRQRAPATLRFVAVGGAAVGERLIRAARAAGIPAYEGYGLSEGASVQALNLPGADRPGSAGRPLPHVRLRVAGDGELQVAGSLMCGYLGDTSPVATWWPTGDLGHVDADGFVHLLGRKKNVLITGYGRNVCPEWVETTLRSEPALAEAVVFGDGQPALSAVLWPASADAGDATLAQAVSAANAMLPDYARVRHWVRARAPFDAASGLATGNGRPRRSAIWRLHADAIQQEYQ